MYGPPLTRGFASYFSTLEIFHTLYPSKRARAPFVTQETYLLSMFHGNMILFERDIQLSFTISGEIIDLIQQFFTKFSRKNSSFSRKKSQTSFGQDDSESINEQFTPVSNKASDICVSPLNNNIIISNNNINNNNTEMNSSSIRRDHNIQE